MNKYNQRAAELFPFETCTDKLTERLRNGVLELMRQAFLQGCIYQEEQVRKYLEQHLDEAYDMTKKSEIAYDYYNGRGSAFSQMLKYLNLKNRIDNWED